MTTNNSYIQYAVEKGYAAAEAQQTACRMTRTFPCTIGARTFRTQEEHDEALADFLNSYRGG